ncbi:MAG: protein TolQ [Myxococcota bacterium]
MPNVFYASLVSLQQTAPPSGGEHEALDPWKLILEASWVVQSVMVILILMALVCWFIMGAKLVRLAQASGRSRRFLDTFWGGDEGPNWTTERLESLYAQVGGFEGSPIASVFRAGYVELARVMGAASATDLGDIENVERALRRTATTEMTAIEAMLPFLATTGATAPFIGLFGTVWGILVAFHNMGSLARASLDVVAPGIAEALIATAIGLLAAIPAVMAYNYFVRRIQVLESELQTFSNDYLNIVRRHFLRT